MTETLKFDNGRIEAGRKKVDGQPDTPEEVPTSPEVFVVNADRHRLILDGLKHSRQHGYDVGKYFAAIHPPEGPSAKTGV